MGEVEADEELYIKSEVHNFNKCFFSHSAAVRNRLDSVHLKQKFHLVSFHLNK